MWHWLLFGSGGREPHYLWEYPKWVCLDIYLFMGVWLLVIDTAYFRHMSTLSRIHLPAEPTCKRRLTRIPFQGRKRCLFGEGNLFKMSQVGKFCLLWERWQKSPLHVHLVSLNTEHPHTLLRLQLQSLGSAFQHKAWSTKATKPSPKPSSQWRCPKHSGSIGGLWGYKI